MYLPNSALLQGGKYRIERYISAGGFGCTYEGFHVLLKKRIAIKEFFVKDFCNRDEATATITVGTTSKAALVQKLKAKFIEEAQAVSELKHPNIVNVYDVFEENGTAYYVMDYIDGSSLDEIIKVHGPLSEQKATKYILQVADALKYVHAKNRLHLDIKPGNIMVDKEGNAVLIDFGSSKQYDEESGENTSTLLGYTPGYAPSEQCAKNVTRFSPATDIYALGATFYKLLTGVTPLEMTLRASGEQLQPLPTTVSKNVRNAISRAMQMNKIERTQSVEEFVKGLSGVSGPEPPQPGGESKKSLLFRLTQILMGLFTVGGFSMAICWIMCVFFSTQHISPYHYVKGGCGATSYVGWWFCNGCDFWDAHSTEQEAITHMQELSMYNIVSTALWIILISVVGISGLLQCRKAKFQLQFEVFVNNSSRILSFAWFVFACISFIILGFICCAFPNSYVSSVTTYIEATFAVVLLLLSFIGLYLISTQRRWGIYLIIFDCISTIFVLLIYCNMNFGMIFMLLILITSITTSITTLGMFLKRNGKSYWQYCKEVEQ